MITPCYQLLYIHIIIYLIWIGVALFSPIPNIDHKKACLNPSKIGLNSVKPVQITSLIDLEYY